MIIVPATSQIKRIKLKISVYSNSPYQTHSLNRFSDLCFLCRYLISSCRMKKVLSLIVLMLTLVLSQNDLYAHKRMIEMVKIHPKPGEVTVSSTEAALRDLAQEGKPILGGGGDDYFLLLSPYCRTLDMQLQITDYRGDYRGDFKRTCYVVGVPWDNLKFSLHVISKDTKQETTPGSQACANMPQYQAVILRFAEESNTYMILDPEKAPWFFTDALGGCDIFVATAENQGNKPLVIHANRNQFKDQTKNLQDKEDSVNGMLANLNGNYRIIARAYFLPRNPPELVGNVQAYIAQYEQNHPGIRLLPYNNYIRNQAFYFFGQYMSTQEPARWRFYLKGAKDGSLSHFDVSQQGNSLDEMKQTLVNRPPRE